MSSFFAISQHEFNEDDFKQIEELNNLLSQLGIEIILKNPDVEKNQPHPSIAIIYDTKGIKEKLTRNAGRKTKFTTKTISPEEVRERMQHETAEEIAKDLGISRASLFRKLKAAEKNKDDELL